VLIIALRAVDVIKVETRRTGELPPAEFLASPRRQWPNSAITMIYRAIIICLAARTARILLTFLIKGRRFAVVSLSRAVLFFRDRQRAISLRSIVCANVQAFSNDSPEITAKLCPDNSNMRISASVDCSSQIIRSHSARTPRICDGSSGNADQCLARLEAIEGPV